MCFYFSSLVCLQEEIEKHVTIHLSDVVPEWGKQWHSHLCPGSGVEPPQSVPVSGKVNSKSAQTVSGSVMVVFTAVTSYFVLLSFVALSRIFAVGVFLQHVQRLLEGVQHDGNQPGDPRPEHWHRRWENFCRQQSAVFVCLFNWQFLTVSCAALQVVFGSLYRDDVLIKPSRVVSILAAACMLQLVSTLNEVTYWFQSSPKPTNLIVCHCLLWCTGRFDPAVWRDHEGKHQCEDCVRLLCLCQYLRLGLSHEKVRL